MKDTLNPPRSDAKQDEKSPQFLGIVPFAEGMIVQHGLNYHPIEPGRNRVAGTSISALSVGWLDFTASK